MTQALFARLTAREWLARYAPERLPKGDSAENYPVAQIPPGKRFPAGTGAARREPIMGDNANGERLKKKLKTPSDPARTDALCRWSL
jgi:hypothetical protein